MRSVAANAMTLVIALAIVVAGVVGWGRNAYFGPGPTTEERVVFVPRGAGLDRVADMLAAEGVIGSASLFRIGARYAGRNAVVRYGEYAVPAGASMAEVFDILVSGRTVQHPLTVPEGLTSWEVAALVNGSELLSGDPVEPPPEGTLAPDTYFLSRGDGRAEVLARMRSQQQRILAEAWAARAEGIAISSPEQALILASLIEKETALDAERARVSAVFHNRLRRGMRLQTDPTIIYGLTEGRGPLGRELTRRDIAGPTRWNTYVIDGLPPTPIANPGRASIEAAVRPAESDELYFVADGAGGHAFARTLEEHNRNVAAWRAIERRRAQP
jgi:UPF0755 protein